MVDFLKVDTTHDTHFYYYLLARVHITSRDYLLGIATLFLLPPKPPEKLRHRQDQINPYHHTILQLVLIVVNC